MIRKFGYDDIYRFAGEGDEKKVLVGIRRKKERAKKKKAAGGEGEGDEEGVSLSSDVSGHVYAQIKYIKRLSSGYVLMVDQENIKWKRIR